MWHCTRLNIERRKLTSPSRNNAGFPWDLLCGEDHSRAKTVRVGVSPALKGGLAIMLDPAARKTEKGDGQGVAPKGMKYQDPGMRTIVITRRPRECRS